MVSDVSERLTQLREKAGLSIQQVADELEKSKSSYVHYEARYKKPYLPPDLATQLAAIFGKQGVDPSEVLSLAGLSQEPIRYKALPTDFPEKLARPPFAQIPRYKAELSAGAGRFNPDSTMPEDFIPFTWEFLERRLQRTNIDGLVMLGVAGDSMSPTINDDDLVMVDRTKTRLDAGVFAFVLDGVARVKRINVTMRGIDILSDNSTYGPEHYTRKELSEMQVIGRVRWVGRAL
jgi:phage repressor protein C with HTH and peptisase S24 domain